MKFFSGHGELFLESLRQVVEILSQSPDYKGERTGRYGRVRAHEFMIVLVVKKIVKVPVQPPDS